MTIVSKYPLRIFEFAAVTNVVDGDTADVVIDCGYSIKVKHRFRLSRIDTPERGEPGWQEATDYLRNATLNRDVVLHVTKVADKYGRYLAEIFLPGQVVSVNQAMVDNGLARLYGAVRVESQAA